MSMRVKAVKAWLADLKDSDEVAIDGRTRCNRNSWYLENGMRLCLEHRPTLWPGEKKWANMKANQVGPCDWPMERPVGDVETYIEIGFREE